MRRFSDYMSVRWLPKSQIAWSADIPISRQPDAHTAQNIGIDPNEKKKQLKHNRCCLLNWLAVRRSNSRILPYEDCRYNQKKTVMSCHDTCCKRKECNDSGTMSLVSNLQTHLFKLRIGKNMVPLVANRENMVPSVANRDVYYFGICELSAEN